MSEIYKYFIAALIGILFCAGLLFGGWQAHKWYTGYEDNKLNEVKEVVKTTQDNLVSAISKNFEDQKQAFDDNSTDIHNQLKKVTVKNIYQIGCVDQDGVDILKISRDKSAKLRGFTNDEK